MPAPPRPVRCTRRWASCRARRSATTPSTPTARMTLEPLPAGQQAAGRPARRAAVRLQEHAFPAPSFSVAMALPGPPQGAGRPCPTPVGGGPTTSGAHAQPDRRRRSPRRRVAAAACDGRVLLAIPFDEHGAPDRRPPRPGEPRRMMLAVNTPYTGDPSDFCTSDDAVTMGVQWPPPTGTPSPTSATTAGCTTARRRGRCRWRPPARHRDVGPIVTWAWWPTPPGPRRRPLRRPLPDRRRRPRRRAGRWRRHRRAGRRAARLDRADGFLRQGDSTASPTPRPGRPPPRSSAPRPRRRRRRYGHAGLRGVA